MTNIQQAIVPALLKMKMQEMRMVSAALAVLAAEALI